MSSMCVYMYGGTPGVKCILYFSNISFHYFDIFRDLFDDFSIFNEISKLSCVNRHGNGEV